MSLGRSTAPRPASAERGAARLHPGARLAGSERKIRRPFELDPALCLYSPQANVDALHHPRVAEWLAFIQDEWTPTPVARERRRVGLLLPCTKYKPYFTSREHRSINAGLLAAGWRSTAPFDGPAEVLSLLEPDDDPDLFACAPLVRDGVVLDRFVISEPMALVPYEHTMTFRGGQSPAVSYDDPGLFENRGTSVSPERDDCTATERSDGTWTWGANERAAYAHMHNAMADALAVALGRLAPAYDHFVAWTSPGLTHRSFLADAAYRTADRLPTSRRGPDGDIPLHGALDAVPGAVAILPTVDQATRARAQLTTRLAAEGRRTTDASVRSVYARGDGHDTPLGLPELVDHLVDHLDTVTVSP